MFRKAEPSTWTFVVSQQQSRANPTHVLVKVCGKALSVGEAVPGRGRGAQENLAPRGTDSSSVPAT